MAAERLEIMHLLVPVENRLGEGALWHPERGELFWTDIEANEIFACDADGKNARRWSLGEAVGSMAWLDRDHLLLAGETGLWRFDLTRAEAVKRWDLEGETAETRANDGRCDPHGAFWVGTMGRRFEPGAGSLYRVGAAGPEVYRRGITVPNSLAFAPDGRTAYWTDTRERVIRKQALTEDGTPEGEPEPFVCTPQGVFPDGAVCDAEGCLWSAQWDGWRVVRYRPDGTEDRVVEMPVQRPTCPAFGGEGLTRLFVTTARVGLDEGALKAQPGAGGVFAMDVDVPGVPEPRFRHLDGWEE